MRERNDRKKVWRTVFRVTCYTQCMDDMPVLLARVTYLWVIRLNLSYPYHGLVFLLLLLSLLLFGAFVATGQSASRRTCTHTHTHIHFKATQFLHFHAQCSCFCFPSNLFTLFHFQFLIRWRTLSIIIITITHVPLSTFSKKPRTANVRGQFVKFTMRVENFRASESKIFFFSFLCAR